MDFFQSQQTAKRNTGKLLFLFMMAVGSLIVITNLLVMFALGYANSANPDSTLLYQFDWGLFALISVGVLAVIVLGSLYKLNALSGGGARVAEMMNGRLLVEGSDDFYERRALNVVEEMALASGTPVPPLYLIEESGINAFAAGYSPSDAVIGVTRGTIENLTRDQLQGVIAHEFSHILHGDMRINIRLMGVLHGIMILGIAGYYLTRGSMYSRRSKNGGGIIALGIGLIVVGYVGTFFGNLIKAAVSRQREYLADASAVQYTRNPEGIGEALMRIATHDKRSYMDNPASQEINHTLFEEAGVSALGGLYATHPLLEERIRAVLPRWSGDFSDAAQERPRTHSESAQDRAEAMKAELAAKREKMAAILAGGAVLPGVMAQGFAGPATSSGDQQAQAALEAGVESVGNSSADHMLFAEDLMQRLPAELLAAAHQPSSARALVYLLVLDEEESVRREQLGFIQGFADHGVHGQLMQLLSLSPEVAREFRLPLVSICLSSLRQLSKPQYQLFKTNFLRLIKMDGKVSLFEWALQKIVIHHLDAVFNPNKSRSWGRRKLHQSQQAIAVMLSIVTHSSAQRGLSKDQVFAQGAAKLNGLSYGLFPVAELSFERLNDALDELADLQPLQKPALLKAIAAVIVADGEVDIAEKELFRAIADVLDCPMPPLLTKKE